MCGDRKHQHNEEMGVTGKISAHTRVLSLVDILKKPVPCNTASQALVDVSQAMQ